MRNFRVHSVGVAPLEVEATDEKGAINLFKAQNPDYGKDMPDDWIMENTLEVEEFLPPVKPMFVRVHLGFITVNLIPKIAEELGYKEGSRFANEPAMFEAIAKQNIHIVEMWYNERNEKMPTDFLEAAKYMVEHTVNDN